MFEPIDPCPVWNTDQAISVKTLEAILVYASADAGLTESQEVTADSILHSYTLYLVKQGIRLSELEQVIGNIKRFVELKKRLKSKKPTISVPKLYLQCRKL